jgi:hypothetical protein
MTPTPACPLVTLDPGIRGCGLAMVDSTGELAHAAYVRNPLKRGGDGAAIASMVGALEEILHVWVPWSSSWDKVRWAVAVEMPQIYTAGKGKGDPNDLLPLMGVVGGLVSMRKWDSITTYRPRAWKGTINPDILTARICTRAPGALLTCAEFERADKVCASLAHNMWDAVGIGLHHFGRLTVGKVYPGATQG